MTTGLEHTDEMKYVDDANAMGGLILEIYKKGDYINDLNSVQIFPHAFKEIDIRNYC